MTRFRFYVTTVDGARLAFFLGSSEELARTAKSCLIRGGTNLKVATDTPADKALAAFVLSAAREAAWEAA